nr:MAG TPA: hypothetical protein [Caudoviricetes sp.]
MIATVLTPFVDGVQLTVSKVSLSMLNILSSRVDKFSIILRIV